MDSTSPVAVITGAASGIGRALVDVCLKRGMRVVMADNNADRLFDVIHAMDCEHVHGVVCDVSLASSVVDLAHQTLNRFHRVDWLINNAGISGQLAPFWTLDTEHIRHVMDVNLYGVMHGIQAFLPIMFKQPHRSHIINMSSLYGLCSGSCMSAYAMSKHAIVALSESLYFDFKRLSKPVDISVVCPSFAQTGLLDSPVPAACDGLHEKVRELLERGREPADIANHIVNEVEKNVFYILPDKEVKNYYEQKMQAVIDQTPPHQHSMEKIIQALDRRVRS